MKKLLPVFERYLSAYFDLVHEKGLYDRVRSDFSKIKELLKISEFEQIVTSPLYLKYNLEPVLKKVFDIVELTDLTAHFIFVLAHNGRLYGLKDIVSAFPREIAKRLNQPIVEVTAAQKLNEEQLSALRKDLEGILSSNILLEVSVDPKLIGGLVVKTGSYLFDTSLKTKLNRIQSYMKGMG